MHLVVAINPTAAFGRTRDTGERVIRELRLAGHDVTALVERSAADLARVASAVLSSRPDGLVVVGGDGMVHLGVNLVARTGTPLGIVPTGTGNDMARGLNIPIGNAGAAITALLGRLGRPPRVIDAGLITGSDGSSTWFAGVLSGGFDAIVNERANSMRFPRGRSRYTIALLLELARLAPIRYELELDGVRSSRKAILVAVGNNVSFGGGMRVAPDARLEDGLFDVVTLDPVNRRQLLRIFPSVFSGTHIRDPRMTVQRARRVTIDAPRVVVYADGERIGPFPLVLEVVPAALAVLA